MRIVKAIHTTAMYQMLIHPVKHDVGHLRITDQMVAVVAILIELMKVNIIQTRATIKHAVIDDEPFEMEYAKRFTVFTGTP